MYKQTDKQIFTILCCKVCLSAPIFFICFFIIFQLILLLGGIPFLWNLSGDLLGKYGYSGYEVGNLAKLSPRFMGELIKYQYTQAFS